jgi:hypothetical protein
MRDEGAITSINNQPQIRWESAYIYGSDRVGEFQANKIISGGKQKPIPIVSIPNVPQVPDTPPGGPISASNSIGKTTSLLNDINFALLTQIIPLNPTNLGSTSPTGSISKTHNQIPFDYKATTSTFRRAEKQYELTNHLGNVLTTISDRKSIDSSSNQDGLVSTVTTATDYYPGGMIQPARNYIYENIRNRFKHQSQESDDEIAGAGTNYFYKYRMSDARLNRFWSVDPLKASLFHLSPYQFSGNRLNDRIEFKGLYPKPPGKKVKIRKSLKRRNNRDFSGTTKLMKFFGQKYSGKRLKNQIWGRHKKKVKPINKDDSGKKETESIRHLGRTASTNTNPGVNGLFANVVQNQRVNNLRFAEIQLAGFNESDTLIPDQRVGSLIVSYDTRAADGSSSRATISMQVYDTETRQFRSLVAFDSATNTNLGTTVISNVPGRVRFNYNLGPNEILIKQVDSEFSQIQGR